MTYQNSKFLNFVLSFCILISGFWTYAFPQEVKKPNVSGAFYPDDPKQLSSMIDDFMEQAGPKEQPGEIFALISPHAGYGFSGQTAAYGYKLVKGKPYTTVIIIGPSHHYGFDRASVWPEGYFQTPLGRVEVDKDFTQKILYKDPLLVFEPKAFSKEHSIEVQIPFLQRALGEGKWKIVPIIVGDLTFKDCVTIANILKDAIGNRNDVLVVASTDMYHGYDYQEAGHMDKLAMLYLEKMDPQELYYGLRESRIQLCGGFSVVVTMLLAKDLGHTKIDILKYTNSAVVTGKKVKGEWTVGYSSSVIDQPKGDGMLLNNDQRVKLLGIARKTIEHYLKTGKKLEVVETDPVLNEKMGAFVTLHEHGQLRGCIGNIVGTNPLYITIRDMAIESAVGDPRFEPVELAELKNIDIEISALSVLERVDSADRIELGKHGVLVKRGFNSGVFLPQVATETGWSKEEFLSSLCTHKAGIPADAWKDKDTELYIFSAEVFSEKSY